MNEKPTRLFQGTHPDTACFGVSGGVDRAPIGRRAVRGRTLPRAVSNELAREGRRPPPGFTGVWGLDTVHPETGEIVRAPYYVRGVRNDRARYAGAFSTTPDNTAYRKVGA